MSGKHYRHACYGLTVSKSENKPVSITFMMVDYKQNENILYSPMGRVRVRIRLEGSMAGIAQLRADREYIITATPESFEGFRIDVITRTNEKSKYNKHYANNKEHLIRWAETCYPDYVEQIKDALSKLDEIVIR